MNNKPVHISQLTFLRFMAACLVVVCHFGKNTFPFNQPYIKDFIDEGAFIVSFFFFLSGVVLGLNYITSKPFNVKRFYIKRIARIYPLYLSVFALTLFLTMYFNGSYPRGISIILQALGLQSWLPGACLEINFPTWSISVEIFFYMVFPLFVWWFKKLRIRTISIIVIIIWAASIFEHYYFINHVNFPKNMDAGQFILYLPLWHLNAFLFGILCSNFINQREDEKKSIKTLKNLSLFIGFAIPLIILTTENSIKPLVHNGALSPVFMMIVYGLSNKASFIARVFANKKLVFLGNTSYSMYILQWPIYILFTQIMGLEDLTGLIFFLYLILLIIISAITYYYFEEKARFFVLKKLSNK